MYPGYKISIFDTAVNMENSFAKKEKREERKKIMITKKKIHRGEEN